MRITAYLSIETLQARREWQDILKVMKEKNLQPRLLYPARISFKYEGEIKSFSDKQKLREFCTTKPALQQILKAAREKQQITHKGIPIRIKADLSIETLQARREWQDILKVMKEKNLQPRLLYPARISFKYEGEIKSFTDKQKLKEFSIGKPALQQMLKDLL